MLRVYPSLLLVILAVSGGPIPAARAQSNTVVNMSHYDHVTPDFAAMKRAGIVGVIHEVTYPPGVVDDRYAQRQGAATRAGLLWGAYHFGNGSDPVRQADFFLAAVARQARAGTPRPQGVLLVLDFEQNTHYPGGTMTVPQAAAFIRRVRERTGKSPGLYSNENRVKKVLGDPGVSEADKRELRSCWLWIANYHYVPRETGPWGKWTLWQYTGDGICDLPSSSYPKHIANLRNAERNKINGSSGTTVALWRDRAWALGSGAD
jgi:lysozyme